MSRVWKLHERLIVAYTYNTFYDFVHYVLECFQKVMISVLLSRSLGFQNVLNFVDRVAQLSTELYVWVGY